MIMQRTVAGIIGAGFLVVGVMRFIPLENLAGWEQAEPIHGFLHLVSGAAYFWSAWANQGRYAKWMTRWNGLFWLLLGIVGNLGLLESVEALAFDDNAVHLIVGVISIAVGWLDAAVSLVRGQSRAVS